MFCPTCGGSNTLERKFCVHCGTNLELVAQALSGGVGSFFNRIDVAIDQLIASYSEHVFKATPSKIGDRGLKEEWKVLGQGVVTSLYDMVLFMLMWNIFPLRFLMLSFAAPFKLLSRRREEQRTITAEVVTNEPLRLPEAMPEQWAIDAGASISEHTTQSLKEHQRKQSNESESSS